MLQTQFVTLMACMLELMQRLIIKKILLNIYTQTKDHFIEKNIFLTKITDTLKENSGKNMIIGGDFNTILNPNMDQQTGRPITQSMSCYLWLEYSHQQRAESQPTVPLL